jgi:hypothetical protein
LIETTGEVKSRLLTVQNASSVTTATISTGGNVNCTGLNTNAGNVISGQLTILDATYATTASISNAGAVTGSSYDSSTVDSGVITIGGGTVRTGNINIGAGLTSSTAQTIRIGSNDSNATGQIIIFSRPIQPPATVQLLDRDLGYSQTFTATTATYSTGTISLSIPATYFYTNGNYMFRSSLKITSTVAKTLTSIRHGINKTSGAAPLGLVQNCYTDTLINTGTAVILSNKTYQLSSYIRYGGLFSYEFEVLHTPATGTLQVVTTVDFIRIS